MLKALYTSVQHDVNCWAGLKINIALCNGLNTLFICWNLGWNFYASRWPFWIIVCKENNIMKNKTTLFTVNLLKVKHISFWNHIFYNVDISFICKNKPWFWKKEKLKPTYLTQLTPIFNFLTPWARINRGKTMVTSEKHYSRLHVTWVVITMFRTFLHYIYIYCARSLKYALFIEDFFFYIFLLLLMCRCSSCVLG